jgi:hypothetical protein
MTPIAEIVNVHDLLQVVWVSLLAGIGVTATYALAILGGTRAVDLSRSGRGAEALVFGAMCVLALATVAAATVLGIVVMVNK